MAKDYSWEADANGNVTKLGKDWPGKGNTANEKWENSIHPDDRQKVIDTFNAAVAKKGNFDMEYRLNDGTMIHDKGKWDGKKYSGSAEVVEKNKNMNTELNSAVSAVQSAVNDYKGGTVTRKANQLGPSSDKTMLS